MEDAVASKDETTNEGDGGADIIDELDVSSSASPDMMDELKNLDWADELMPVRGGGEGNIYVYICCHSITVLLVAEDVYILSAYCGPTTSSRI